MLLDLAGGSDYQIFFLLLQSPRLTIKSNYYFSKSKGKKTHIISQVFFSPPFCLQNRSLLHSLRLILKVQEFNNSHIFHTTHFLWAKSGTPTHFVSRPLRPPPPSHFQSSSVAQFLSHSHKATDCIISCFTLTTLWQKKKKKKVFFFLWYQPMERALRNIPLPSRLVKKTRKPEEVGKCVRHLLRITLISFRGEKQKKKNYNETNIPHFRIYSLNCPKIKRE